MEIVNRQTKQGILVVTLSGVDSAAASCDATVDGISRAQGARIVSMPATLRSKAPMEYSHIFYATDGTQQPILLKATEMASVLAQIAAYAEDSARLAALPVHQQRRKAERLFEKAAALKDEPGRYFPALLAAQKALASWREIYPDAAREEDRQSILAEADDLEHKAATALVYDADGWLSAQDQQISSAEFQRKATAKREEAAHLE